MTKYVLLALYALMISMQVEFTRRRVAGPACGSLRIAATELSQQFSDGEIDEVQVSSVVRPAAWIKAEYDNGNAPETFYTMGAQQ